MTRITESQLNAVARLLNTTDRNLVITATLHTLTGSGVPADEAYDMIFGEGAFDQTVQDLAEVIRKHARDENGNTFDEAMSGEGPHTYGG